MSRLHEISGCQNENRKADVIFVHGLGGDPFDTWKSGENASWPHWLGEEVPEVGVWSLEYAASPSKWSGLGRLIGFGNRDSGHAMALPRRAGEVLNRLQLQGFGKRPIFFICHSLGGLLVKQVLRAALESLDPGRKTIAEKTRAVLFLATPHMGATLASFLHSFRTLFGSTVSIEDLRAHDAHLGDLYDVYRNHSPGLGIATRTYYEQIDVFGVLPIVSPTSAHPGVGDNPVALDEDHLSIAKPQSRDALVYLAAIDLLRRHVLAAQLPQEKPPPPAGPNRSAAPVPFDLPPAAEKFFGRTAELEKLEARLRAGQNTAVVGPGGLGKTALAAEALRRVVGKHRERLADCPFPDGIVFLDLYAKNGQAEPAWNALASSLAGDGFRPSASARERATEACHGRRILVIVEGGEEANGKDGHATIRELFEVLAPENRWLLLTRNSKQAVRKDTVKVGDALEPADAEMLLDAPSEAPISGPLRKRVLELLQGHPLALTWAGNLLASGDEPAWLLVEDWEKDTFGLSDPDHAERSLRWLYDRSVRDLDQGTKDVLEAAGLLAHAPFPLELIEAAVSPQQARDGLRILVQRGFLRLVENLERWQFGHVLAYRFARVESGSDIQLRESLAIALRDSLRTALLPGGDLTRVATILDHVAALLRADDDQRLWIPLAKPLVYEVYHRLRDLGRLPLAGRALAAVGGFFGRLPVDRAEESPWKREKGSMLDREGHLRMNQGDLAAALASFRESLEIFRRLASADSSNAAWQRDLSFSHNKVGGVLEAQGDLSAALASYRESLEIRRRLASADSSNAAWQRDLSFSHNKVGGVLEAQGDLSAALASYRESLEIDRRLASADSSNAAWQRDLSVSHNKVGGVLEAQGDLSAALASFRESLEISRHLASADSSNAAWQRDLSVSQERVGGVLQAQGDLAAALASYRETLEIARRLASADPSNAAWQRDFSVRHNKVGGVLEAQGDLAAALASYRESLEIARRLASADSSHATWQRDLSISHEKVGGVLEAQGDLAAALASYRETLEIRRRLASADSTNAAWQRDLSFSLFGLAKLHENLGEPTEALQMAEESLAIHEKLAALDPTNATWQKDVKISRALVERLRRG